MQGKSSDFAKLNPQVNLESIIDAIITKLNPQESIDVIHAKLSPLKVSDIGDFFHLLILPPSKLATNQSQSYK